MENSFIYLSSCDTCMRILKELQLPDTIILQDLKKQPVSSEQLEFLVQQAGSYENLFNRRAQLYRARGLHEKNLTEADYKELLLEHYTFIKRPILVFNDTAFIGNSKNTIVLAKEALAL